MKGRAFFASVAVLAVASGATGCGSSEPDPLPEAVFLKQGNAICAQATEERESALKQAAIEGAQGDEESSDAEREKFVVEVALPPIQGMAEELDDLGVPKGSEARVDAIIAGLEEAVARVEADPRSAMTDAPFIRVNRRAEAYGLADCTI